MALTAQEKARFVLKEYLIAGMVASWFPALWLYYASFCSNKVRIIILDEMRKLGDYPMGKLQAINFGSTLFVSLCLSALQLRFNPSIQPADFDRIPFNLFPGSITIIKTMDELRSTPITRSLKEAAVPAYFAFLFMALNYLTFIGGSEVQGRLLENEGKFYSYVLRISFDPALAIMANALFSLYASIALNGLFLGARFVFEKAKGCCQTQGQAVTVTTPLIVNAG